MNTLSAYQSWAPSYDTVRNPTRDLDGDVTRRLLEKNTYAVTVEAGCGTGKNTPFFSSISGAVLALDFSPHMLVIAREKVRAPNVRFEQANLLERWPCDDESAALVSCNLVLEHIANMQRVFNEAARVLVAGGTLFVSELHPLKQYLGGQARFTDAQQVETRIEAYVHHFSDYVHAAQSAGLAVQRVEESWHADDVDAPPRLLTLVFDKTGISDDLGVGK